MVRILDADSENDPLVRPFCRGLICVMTLSQQGPICRMLFSVIFSDDGFTISGPNLNSPQTDTRSVLYSNEDELINRFWSRSGRLFVFNTHATIKRSWETSEKQQNQLFNDF